MVYHKVCVCVCVCVCVRVRVLFSIILDGTMFRDTNPVPTTSARLLPLCIIEFMMNKTDVMLNNIEHRAKKNNHYAIISLQSYIVFLGDLKHNITVTLSYPFQ